MRKRNKGFTLIELLAVIIVLAVIALIATPIIMKTINDAKTGAAQDSAYGYMKATEMSIANVIMENPDKNYDGNYWITEDGDLKNSSNEITINYKGNKPSGAVVVKGNSIVAADIQFGEKCFNYLNNELRQSEDNNVFPYARWNYHGITANKTSSVTIDWDRLQYSGITGNDAYTNTYNAFPVDSSAINWFNSWYGIQVKPGEKYRFSWTTTATSNRSYIFFNTNDSSVYASYIESSVSPQIVTVPENMHYMTFRVGVLNGIGTNPSYSNLKLEKIN